MPGQATKVFMFEDKKTTQESLSVTIPEVGMFPNVAILQVLSLIK